MLLNISWYKKSEKKNEVKIKNIQKYNEEN